MTQNDRKQSVAGLMIILCGLTVCAGILFFMLAPKRPSEQQIERDITAYLRDFGEPPAADWFPAIKRVFVRGDTVIVSTNLESRGAIASGVCGGISGFVFDNTRRYYGLNRIQVIGGFQQGSSWASAMLIDRKGRSDTCQ